MPNTLGTKTPAAIFFKGFDGDNLYEEFVASAAIPEGHLVKLGTDGTIQVIAKEDHRDIIIGVAMMKATGALDKVTVAMRGFGTMHAEGTIALNTGPVEFDSYTSATGYMRFVGVAAGDDAVIGWALDNTVAAGDVIRVVIKN